VSLKLKEQLATEFKLLDKLLEKNLPLIEKARLAQLDEFNIVALGGMLQSFYGGVENIFKRIAKSIDNDLPQSKSWHKDLLDKMALPTNDRPQVISDLLREKLHEYLDFRHIFRSIYSFDLHWQKMEELVFGLEVIIQQLRNEINVFLKTLKD
jgi:hypothetical protein